MASYNHIAYKTVRVFTRHFKYINACTQKHGSSKHCDACGQKIEAREDFLLISAGRNDEIKLCPSCSFDVGEDLKKAFTKKERALSDAKKVVKEL